MTVIEINRLPEAAVVHGTDVNRLWDILLGNDGAKLLFVGYDGTVRDVNLGTSLSTSNYGATFQTNPGNHIAVLLAATSPTATPSAANAVLLVKDAGLSIGAGKELQLWNVAGSNSVNLYHLNSTNDVLKTDDSLWVVAALGVGITPVGLAGGDIGAIGNIHFQSATGNYISFDHAATGARVVTFQDASGTVALLGVANAAGNLTLAGHLLFSPDNTYDIGASGATRPRDLYLARNAIIGGDVTVTGSVVGATKKARVYNSANISHATSGAFQTLTFDSERWDNDTIHDTGSSTSRLTCKTAGLYDIKGQILWAGSATGNRGGRILLNGTTSLVEDIRPTTTIAVGARTTVGTQYELAVNDYVELQSFQDSGGALNVVTSANYSPEFMMARIG